MPDIKVKCRPNDETDLKLLLFEICSVDFVE